MDIAALILAALDQGASDIHLSEQQPPVFRLDGLLVTQPSPPLTHAELSEALHKLHPQPLNKRNFSDIDLAYTVPDRARIRLNIFQHEQGLGAALRLLPLRNQHKTPPPLPGFLASLCAQSQGLVLITGPTGSGKSTTLADMIDHINAHQQRHIITLEDPIEYQYSSRGCLIQQREIGRDTPCFASALRSALRQDPDILMVGELRDLATIRLALTAAETGHLVLSTLHTNSAAATINRLIDVFPGEEKPLISTLLSGTLSAVIAQQLVRKKGGGRMAVQERLRCTPAIRNLIQSGKVNHIQSAIETGRQYGMQTMAQALAHLAPEVATKNAATVLN